MILRKPYAFLIKNFRMIHGVLTILFVFILYQTNTIYSFFRDYLINSKYLKLYIEPTITSINWYIYLALFASIVILFFIFLLMNRKNKPVKYYLFSIIFYIALIFVFFFSRFQISALARNNANLQLISGTRDILQLFYYGQYFWLFVCILRTIGFNIKSFNFQSDLKELSILQEDNEEFELDVELDSNDVKTKLRRNIRTIKIFFIENKLLLMFLSIISCLLITIFIILDVKVYNKIYSENEQFKYSDLTMKVLNTYETTNDYYSLDLSSEGYVYYVVKFEIANKTSGALSIDKDSIRLKVGEYNYYGISTNDYNSFYDIGVGYNNQTIKAGETVDYIISFKIEETSKNDTKILECLEQTFINSFKYVKIKLEPQNIDEIVAKESVNLKETLNIDSDIVGKLSMNIEEYSLSEIMEYKYEETINNKKYTFTEIIQPSTDDLYKKQILRLKTNIDYSSELSNSAIIEKFISQFGHIRYIKNNVEYENPFKIVDITPSNSKGYTYLEVLSDVSTADEIYLDIIIRNGKYIYKLK